MANLTRFKIKLSLSEHRGPNTCRTVLRFTSAVAISLIALQAGAAPACRDLFRPVERSQAYGELQYLTDVVGRFAPLGETPSGPQVKLMMGAIEIGRIPGLKTSDGKPLNLAVGGIGTVMNDTWSAKAPVLANRGIETIAVTPLMRNIDKSGMTFLKTVQVKVGDQFYDVNIHQYQMPAGGRVLFLESPLITERFDALPAPGGNIYEMHGLPQENEAREIEKQRIWSLINQAAAKAYDVVGADAYIPQDGHLAPASYYVARSSRHQALTLAPVLHNERYLDVFWEGSDRSRVARIWNVDDMGEFEKKFMYRDLVVMLAPAIRTAEHTGVFTAKSVANNTARVLNEEDLPADIYPRIELFQRLSAEENFLAASNRPDVSAGLAHASAAELLSEGISNPEIVKTYARPNGYQFGRSARDVVRGKARAKRAVQQLFGFDVDPNKPLFVTFARLVEQKGLDFLAPNIERILQAGGQVVVGGPVGDASGAAAQKAFLAEKARLEQQNPALARNFHVIEGSVMGRRKALLLAAADFFPVPSRFEPCGLTDVEALFNGAQPIAPAIGGLVKGKNTIKYQTADTNNQAGDLGSAIDHAREIYFQEHKQFLRRQVSATREDFSLEKHLEKVLLNHRIEIYYRIIQELDQLVSTGQVGLSAAETYIQRAVFDRHPGDKAEVISAVRMIHESRRSALVKWVAEQN